MRDLEMAIYGPGLCEMAENELHVGCTAALKTRVYWAVGGGRYWVDPYLQRL